MPTCSFCETSLDSVCQDESHADLCPRRAMHGVADIAGATFVGVVDAIGELAGVAARAAVATAEVAGSVAVSAAEVTAEVASDVISSVADAALD